MHRYIELLPSSLVIVDEADFEEISKYRWTMHNEGYAKRNYRREDGVFRTMMMHRQIAGLLPGDRRVVDHINGNKLDNRRANIRVCSHAENIRNSKLWKSSSSGLKGVHYSNTHKTWIAKIKVNGKGKHLGSYETAEKAHEAYCIAADLLHGEFANYGTYRGDTAISERIGK